MVNKSATLFALTMLLSMFSNLYAWTVLTTQGPELYGEVEGTQIRIYIENNELYIHHVKPDGREKCFGIFGVNRIFPRENGFRLLKGFVSRNLRFYVLRFSHNFFIIIGLQNKGEIRLLYKPNMCPTNTNQNQAYCISDALADVESCTVTDGNQVVFTVNATTGHDGLYCYVTRVS